MNGAGTGTMPGGVARTQHLSPAVAMAISQRSRRGPCRHTLVLARSAQTPASLSTRTCALESRCCTTTARTIFHTKTSSYARTALSNCIPCYSTYWVASTRASQRRSRRTCAGDFAYTHTHIAHILQYLLRQRIHTKCFVDLGRVLFSG